MKANAEDWKLVRSYFQKRAPSHVASKGTPDVEEEDPLLGTGFAMYSHPVATAYSTVGFGGLHSSTSTSFHHLAALARDGGGFGRGGMLGSGVASSSSSGSSVASSRFVIFLLSRGVSSGLGDGLCVLLVLVDGPVKDVIVLEGLANKEIAENLSQVRVVRLVIETERSSVIEIDGELIGKATAKDLGWCRHLLLHDTIVLLLLGSSLQSLPGKRATAEIEHDITQ